MVSVHPLQFPRKNGEQHLWQMGKSGRGSAEIEKHGGRGRILAGADRVTDKEDEEVLIFSPFQCADLDVGNLCFPILLRCWALMLSCQLTKEIGGGMRIETGFRDKQSPPPVIKNPRGKSDNVESKKWKGPVFTCGDSRQVK